MTSMTSAHAVQHPFWQRDGHAYAFPAPLCAVPDKRDITGADGATAEVIVAAGLSLWAGLTSLVCVLCIVPRSIPPGHA
jgi:hypothetical protein